jgi:hypothetical protein
VAVRVIHRLSTFFGGNRSGTVGFRINLKNSYCFLRESASV